MMLCGKNNEKRSKGLPHCVYIGHYRKRGTKSLLKTKKIFDQALKLTFLCSILIWFR